MEDRGKPEGIQGNFNQFSNADYARYRPTSREENDKLIGNYSGSLGAYDEKGRPMGIPLRTENEQASVSGQKPPEQHAQTLPDLSEASMAFPADYKSDNEDYVALPDLSYLDDEADDGGTGVIPDLKQQQDAAITAIKKQPAFPLPSPPPGRETTSKLNAEAVAKKQEEAAKRHAEIRQQQARQEADARKNMSIKDRASEYLDAFRRGGK